MRLLLRVAVLFVALDNPAFAQSQPQPDAQREMVKVTRLLAEHTDDIARYTLSLVVV